MLQMVSIVSAQIVTEGEPNKLTDIDLIFGNVISFILPLGSIVLFVMIIYGGIKYITAGPNPSAVQNAKSTLTYAIVGVVLLAMGRSLRPNLLEPRRATSMRRRRADRPGQTG